MLRRLAVLLARDGALAGGARRAAVGAAAARRVAEGLGLDGVAARVAAVKVR